MLRILITACLFAAAFVMAVVGHAQISIDITKSEIDPTRIAIPEFIGQGAGASPYNVDIPNVISADLERSGLFEPLDRAAFIETQSTIDYEPTWQSWRVINAEVLVSGRVIEQDEMTITVEYRLWDIYGNRQLDAARLRTPKDNWRRIAHKISDRIYTALTGEAGYFDSRIVYVAEDGPKTQRRKRLSIMDQDGANQVYLVSGSDLVLTPRFHPSEQRIAFLSYETGRPDVFLMDITTGNRERLGRFDGMTTSPQFSPDGDTLLMTRIINGDSDIFSYDLSSRKLTALTRSSGIDTSPSYSPDGRNIVFNSSRGGSRQLYVMSAAGRNVKRISFGSGQYTAPAWSPRGDKIAFTKSEGGRFHIGVMNADGSNEKLLTSSYLDEGPTWSPNGRVLLFSREPRGGQSGIYSVDLTGRNLRRVATLGAASDPAWGPTLK
ncbi:Tol-Pal system beta propeller repeat protein TolB [Robiginitomaculum antarcticum]|uniref:Tol-Pal system beta propeller repeat protein TolB n=1 Tax=Robiginitomaculum antarcticum TaxID=437507 RepID=UPI0003678950|nr:Tol-Pal system beta propeller repeat protein TolB [Robiginitomaculum antarcticum]